MGRGHNNIPLTSLGFTLWSRNILVSVLNLRILMLFNQSINLSINQSKSVFLVVKVNVGVVVWLIIYMLLLENVHYLYATDKVTRFKLKLMYRLLPVCFLKCWVKSEPYISNLWLWVKCCVNWFVLFSLHSVRRVLVSALVLVFYWSGSWNFESWILSNLSDLLGHPVTVTV